MPATDSVLSVSSFSLREELGPLVFRYRDAAGAPQTFRMDYPRIFPISEYPARARDYFGIETIETCTLQFDGLGDPEVDRFGLALAESGTSLLNVCVDVGDLADPDDVRRTADMAELEQWIARFAAMGARFVRVNSGSPRSSHHGDRASDVLVRSLVEVGEFAASVGTRLLVENHGGRSSDPAWMTDLLDRTDGACGLLLDLGNFPALLDPLHAFIGGASDLATLDLAACIEDLDLTPLYADIDALAPRAEHVSLKMHLVSVDGTLGAVDLPRALGILASHDYSGPMAVEWEGSGGDPWAKSLRILDAARAILAPQGD